MGVVVRGTKKNYLGILIVGGIGLLLYFLPEIAKLAKPSAGTQTVDTEKTADKQDKSEKAEPLVVVEEIPESSRLAKSEPEPQVKSTNDPLSKVLGKIDSGAFDPPEATAAPALSNKEQPKGDDFSVVAVIVKAPKLSWDLLTRREVTNVVKEAMKRAQILNKNIDPTQVRSKAALTQYVAGLNNFLRGDLKKLEPRTALDYLGKTDLDVTAAFSSEAVSRPIFKQWAGVSLGALVDGAGANVKKKEAIPAFKADMILSSLKMKEQKINRKNPEIPSSNIDVQGIVIGLDSSVIEIYRNGELINSVKLGKVKKGEKSRKFTFSYKGNGAIHGIFRLRARDEEGFYIDKAYRFMPNAQRFRRKNGSFEIPEVYVDLTRPISKTLDQRFLVGGSASDTGLGEFHDKPPKDITVF